MDSSKIKNLETEHVLFDRFRIIRKLGNGGFGAVYEAYDYIRDIRIAIKVEQKKRQFSTVNKEAEILMNMQGNHHVLQFLGSGEQNNCNYLLMEIAGASLSKLLQRRQGRKFPLPIAAQFGCNFVEALKEVHNAGYLHRDVKPSNFVLKEVGNLVRVCIIDFGLAEKMENNDKAVRNKNNQFVGTLKYASPNVHKRKPYGQNDDMMSMFYTFLEISGEGLPWGEDNEEKIVAQKKVKTDAKTLIGSKPKAAYQIYMKLQSLTHKDSIAYDWFIDKFRSMMMCDPAAADKSGTNSSKCKQQNEIKAKAKISAKSVV
ncbi:Tau-tubulin kinase 1 [Trichinella pseudospiralis]|uniref:non-specific serine/threonine protein kinase n=1 Tax=Trichinella pseudospiralis TaxID=6337 RepID=A0A0V1E9D3_TRIPS|nr:Tau-tubulin kinase 1 [Trichinella pseudospiralis]KRZ34409.1 Tau-tubulin kinase 1 [Trichinella pseudospiralis]